MYLYLPPAYLNMLFVDMHVHSFENYIQCFPLPFRIVSFATKQMIKIVQNLSQNFRATHIQCSGSKYLFFVCISRYLKSKSFDQHKK